jgi:flagellin
VALSAGETVSDLLGRMKQLALSAADINLDQSSRDALQEEYRSASSQIRKVVQNASFNGVNLLDGSSPGYNALANSKGTATVNVNREEMTFRATAGTAAKLTGIGVMPGIAAASSFTVALDGGTATTVNIAAGDGAAAIATKINNTLGKNVATVNNSGFLELTSTTYGTGSAVAVVGVSGDTAAGTVNAELFGGAPTATAAVAATGGSTIASFEVTGNETFTASTNYTALLKQLDDSIANVSKAVGRLGSGSKTMESTFNFVSKLQDTLQQGIGALVDADLAKESARLQALQTKQQLGVQALSIANQSTGILLGLFR